MTDKLTQLVEAILLSADNALSLDQLLSCLNTEQTIAERHSIKESLIELEAQYSEHYGIDFVQVAGGYRLQTANVCAPYINAMYQEKPQKYGRATLETLAIIAYRQPITRGDIEDVRGVAVSSNVMRALLDRGWIKVIGHREVPGRPAIFGTTRQFLDDLSLKSLEDLPALSEIRDLNDIAKELTGEFDFSEPVVGEGDDNIGANPIDEDDNESIVVEHQKESDIQVEQKEDSLLEVHDEDDRGPVLH